MGGCCGQGQGKGAAPRGAQGGQGGQRCVSSSHNEEVCHGTGERRHELLDQVKIFLDEFDESVSIVEATMECTTQEYAEMHYVYGFCNGNALASQREYHSRYPDRKVPSPQVFSRPCQATPRGQGSGMKPLGEYDEYRKKHCQSWAPAQPRPPLITSVQAHEIRNTQDYERMRHQNTEYVTYTDGRLKPPQPSCDCAKRNGLQDQCQRLGCSPPTPQCLASNPGPCCPPSMGLTRDEAAARPQLQNRAPASGGAQCSGQRASASGGAQCSGQRAPASGGAQCSGQRAPASGGAQQYGQGTPMICFCQESPSSMPKGQKYLCCPM